MALLQFHGIAVPKSLLKMKNLVCKEKIVNFQCIILVVITLLIYLSLCSKIHSAIVYSKGALYLYKIALLTNCLRPWYEIKDAFMTACDDFVISQWYNIGPLYCRFDI